MKEQTTEEESASINPYEALESWARANVQDFIQRLLEEEIDEFIGRAKSERHVGSRQRIYRNGHGKTRNFGMMSGTIQVRRPRVRSSEEIRKPRSAAFPSKIEGTRRDVAGAVSAWTGQR